MYPHNAPLFGADTLPSGAFRYHLLLPRFLFPTVPIPAISPPISGWGIPAITIPLLFVLFVFTHPFLVRLFPIVFFM